MSPRASASWVRLLLLAAAFGTTATLVVTAGTQRHVPSRTALRGFPIKVADWQGYIAPDFAARVVRVLGADEYLTRVYQQGSAPPIDLFVGYYGSQAAGSLIHSPLNCLPGAGWQLLSRERVPVQVTGRGRDDDERARTIVVNRVVMQKGDERLVAFYWYHERGRVIANEYVSRAYMMLDAARSGRTDGALVRVVTPLEPDGDATADATDRLVSFVQAVFPLLDGYVPA
jgi:EpsI family protein